MSNPWDLRSCKEIWGMLKNVDLFLIWKLMHLIFNQTQTKSNTGLPNMGYLQSWMDWILDVSPTGHLRLDHPRSVLKNPGIRRLCQCVWDFVHQVFVGHIGHIYILCMYVCIYIWLVVWTPVKNDGLRQLGWFSIPKIYGKSWKFPWFQAPIVTTCCFTQPPGR